jgi:CelD/BcsL family acetyltransferase involved in cellulose biosynthesis
MLSSELIEDLALLDALRDEWDDLALACALPVMGPDWIMAWWRHVAPPGARSRAVAVRDDRRRLVGLAPFYVVPDKRGRIDYRLPGAELGGRLSPLSLAEHERDVAAMIGSTLAQAQPRPDLIALEGLPAGSGWPAALRAGWPGRIRPVTRRYLVQGAPTLSLDAASFDAWLLSKSSNFRGQMRRLRRQFAADGGIARISTPATLQADVEAFVDLHASRWEGLGERLGPSRIVEMRDRFAAMLEDVGAAMPDAGRFRLWMLELDGKPISAQLFVAANGEVAYVNGGWDEQFARFKPAMLGILYAIEDAFARAETRIDLGGGEQPYKLRFADGNDPISWNILIVPGLRLPLTRLRTLPMFLGHALRDHLKRKLPAEHIDRLRTMRKRLRRR